LNSSGLRLAAQALIRRGGYAPLLFVALALMMARLLAGARLLEVTEFAHYSASLLVSSSFCMLGALGLQIMLQRDLPMLFQRGQYRRGFVLLMQALIVAMSCAGVGLIASLLVPSTSGTQALTRTALATGVVHGLSQQCFLLVTVESRSRGQTLSFAGQYLVRSLAVVTTGLVAMASTGSGAWSAAAEATMTLVVSTVLLVGIASRAQMTIALSAILAVRHARRIRWGPAATLLGVYVASWCAQNMDRWIAERMLATRPFAVYTFATNLLVVASAVQMAASASLFPLLATRFAASGHREAFRLATRYSLTLAIACMAASPLIAIGWNLVVERGFPRFEDSTEITPILIAVCVLRIADYWSNFLIVVGAERRLLLATSCSTGLVSTGWLMVLGHGAPTTESIAWLALALAGSSFIAVLGASLLELKSSAGSESVVGQCGKIR
jgi:O-antigen/teichoic acid export membrane protein